VLPAPPRRPQAEPAGLAAGARGLSRRYDEEAWKLSTGDMMGRMMGEYFLPLLGHFGFKDYLKHAPTYRTAT